MNRRIRRTSTFRRDLDELLPQSGIDIVSQDIAEGFEYKQGDVRVIVFDVDHRPVTPAFGYRIEYKDRVVVLSGDTRPCDNLVKFSQGADLLIHEIIAPQAFLKRATQMTEHHRQAVIEHHTTPQQAGEIFSRMNPKLAVYSHVIGGPIPGYEEEILEGTAETYSGAVEIGYDLTRIQVGDEMKSSRIGSQAR